DSTDDKKCHGHRGRLLGSSRPSHGGPTDFTVDLSRQPALPRISDPRHLCRSLGAVTIVPDTKDWTWVLQRPCPECGFDAAALDIDQVPEMVRTNAAAWRDVLADERAPQRPSDDVWSALEYGCHVRDVFRLYDERLQLM